MKRTFVLFIGLSFIAALFTAPDFADARSRSGSSRRARHSYTSSHINATSGVKRDRQGRIKRNSEKRQQFLDQTGYPDGRKGYVVDHVKPLYRGGADAPSNMQWQTIDAAKAKDRIE